MSLDLKMEIQLKRFGFFDFFRMLKLTLNKKTAKEMDKSFFGYIISKTWQLISDRNERYQFSIWDKEKFLGSVGLYGPKNKDYFELGYYVLPEYRKKGIALLATKKILIYLRKIKKKAKIRVKIDKNNAASLKVIRKNKFKLVKRKKRDIIFEKKL